PLDDLPAHPLLSLAKLSVGVARTPAVAPTPAAELWVIEDPEEALEAAADRLVYVAATGAFQGPAGAAGPPSRVGLVRFLVRPELIAADAMALRARGVRWDAVAGAEA